MKYGLLFTLILALGATGCATKSFVRKSLDPLSQRVGTLEGQTGEQGQAIEELETGVSRAEERAQTADQNAEHAGQQASAAAARAEEANRAAADARRLAENGLAGLDAVGSRIDSLNDYAVVAEATVLFRLESSELTESARMQLDGLAASLLPNAPSVIEIQGFTDTTGSDTYNVGLSERRARAVARYFVSEHGVSLRQIQLLGLGSANPAEDNSTRDGRELNRRVEVKLLTADRPAVAALHQD